MWLVVWQCFLLADKFDLRRVKENCLTAVALYCEQMCDESTAQASQRLKDVRQLLEKNTFVELLKTIIELARDRCG